MRYVLLCLLLAGVGCRPAPSEPPAPEAVVPDQISGYVYDATVNEPRSGVRVVLKTHEGLDVRGGIETRTDADGRYAFNGLREATYQVRFTDGWACGPGLDSTYQTAYVRGLNVAVGPQVVNMQWAPDSVRIAAMLFYHEGEPTRADHEAATARMARYENRIGKQPLAMDERGRFLRVQRVFDGANCVALRATDS